MSTVGPGGLLAPTFTDVVDMNDQSTNPGLLPAWWRTEFLDDLSTKIIPKFANAADRDAKGWSSFTAADRAFCVLADTNTLQMWTGSRWVDAFDDNQWMAWAPTWKNRASTGELTGMVNAGTSNATSGRWRALPGKTVVCRFEQIWGDQANVGTAGGEFWWTLPTAARDSRHAGIMAEMRTGGQTAPAITLLHGRFPDSGHLAFRNVADGKRIGRDIPKTWQATDYITTQAFLYERA